MAARPGNEFQLATQLNGQPTRFTLADGGRSGLYAASGVACASLVGAKNNSGVAISPNVLLFVPETPTNLCVRPNSGSPRWDGGCNMITGDENYGVPTQAWVPSYIVPDVNATAVCGISDAGVVRGALWVVQ
jgi:hypothetical protein